MTVRVRTLGSFSIELNGVPQPERRGQPVRTGLIVVLALDRVVTRESVAALLWPESDDERARQALRQTLYVLRRDLGDAWLDATSDTLRATGTLTADAHELVEAAESGDHERVTQLYTGAFLSGIRLVESNPFQLWCDQWGGRLERLHRPARRAVIDGRVAHGDLAGALRIAREWLDLDPFEDEAQHRVLELLSRLGRGDEALREYQAFESRLARQGLEPLDETQALVDRIRTEGRSLPPLPSADGPPDETATTSEAASGPAPAAPDRVLRPRRWRVLLPLTAAAVAAAILLSLVGRRGTASPLDPERIMVLPLVNQTGDSAVDHVGLRSADWITHAVARIAGLQAVPLLDVRQMLAAGLQPEDAAAHRRAGTLVSGRYFRTGDSLELHVLITDMREGEVWHALDPVRISATSPDEGLRELRDLVAGSLGVRFTPSTALPDPSTLDPPSYPAFAALMDAAPYITRGDWAGALPHVQRASELDPTFYRARLLLVTMHRNIGQVARADSLLRILAGHRDEFSPYERVLFRGIRAQIDGDHEQALAAVREAARIDPGGTSHYVSAGIALDAGRPREAIELYSTLDPQCPWAPEWTGAWASWTAAFHLLGEHVRELEEARRARTLHPGRLSVLFLELRARAVGGLDAVEAGLAESERMAPDGPWNHGTFLRRVAAELRRHGYPEAAGAVLGSSVRWYETRPAEERSTRRHRVEHLEALLTAGRLAEAERVLTALRSELPDRVDLLGMEGLLAARLGHRERADSIASRLDTSRVVYQYGRVDYWRAAIAGWSGSDERALSLLRRAFDDGWPRGIALHADPFLEPLWGVPAFRTAVGETR